ncbi:MAG: hypothetical protein WBX22_11420 [Silvibacterium sp.]
MRPGNPRFSSQRLGFCLALASFLSVIGCAVTPGNPPPLSSAAGASSAAGTSAVASGPVLGYGWDQTAVGLRPIFGVPGAAQFGSPVFGGATYNGAGVCADKKYAVLTASNGQAFLALLPSGVPQQIADHLSAKEQIVISPSCSAALLYASGASSALVILGLPGTPKVQVLDLSRAGLVTAATVSDSGLVLVAASQTTGGFNVQAVSADGTASEVTAVGGLGGMAFLPSTQNALIADAARNTISLASNLPGNTALNIVATTADHVMQPAAIASSADGRWLIVANQNGAAILRLDLTRQTPPAQIACNCMAAKLVPLNGNSTFLLSDVTSGPVWTFDGDAPSPRIVFVPAINKSAGAAGGTGATR